MIPSECSSCGQHSFVVEILEETVAFNEVLGRFECENRESKSLDWARDELVKANAETGASWTLVLLSRENILSIMLPNHCHPPQITIIPKMGLDVAAAAVTIKDSTHETGECWENIQSNKNRDFSQTCVFLRFRDGRLWHIDGLHRLLAWVIFEKTEEINAYVVGLRESIRT
jgi:hypothetical protein